MKLTWRTRWANSHTRYKLRWLLGPGDHGWAIYWNGEPAPNWLAWLMLRFGR
jgi:hypothetical protein